MKINAFPTSSDIYLELDGKKIAVVQSYEAQTKKSSATIEAFGESEPVASIPGPSRHTVLLSRLYATESAISDGINFHELDRFNLVICKPDRRVIYSDCQWNHIGETGTLGATVLEKISLVAAKRIETSV